MSTWPQKNSPTTDASEKKTIGAGVFRLCDGCGKTLAVSEFETRYEVCSECGYHHKLPSHRWRELLLDAGHLETWDEELAPDDPLSFHDGKSYRDRVLDAQRKTGVKEAIETGLGRVHGTRIAYGSFVFQFMGGSMGSVVGEKIARMFERAYAEFLPVVLLQSSGGARMQEGILSLMQMAKCVAALERFRTHRLPFISVLLHPTTGGVAASFAFLGDVNIAEPNALIGFAGPRVIESTIHQSLPEGFQKSEFLLNHGMVDMVCSRLEMKETISTLLRHLLKSRSSHHDNANP